MASPPRRFIDSCVTQISQTLISADAWSALKEEFSTFQTNEIVITDADVAHLGVTAPQFTQALIAMQSIVDAIHVPATSAKLYRVRR